jgi:vitamin B12 transporter
MKKINFSLIASAIITSSVYANLNEAKITISSATKSEQSIQDVTSNVEVITGAELKSKNITTLTQALNLVSGVGFTSTGGIGQVSAVKVRGMHQSDLLVLIDGIRYNDITSPNGASFENIMVSNIKQIEVIKGAQSGIWGANASAGVINIITKDSKNGLHGNVNLEIGSYNTKKIGLNTSYKNDKFYINLSQSKLTSDSFSAQAPYGEDISNYEDDAYKNTTTTLKAGTNINETNRIDVVHTVIDAKSNYDTYI